MKPSRSLQNWGVAGLALLAGLLVAPRSSEAGCGGYVWVRGEMVHVPGPSSSHADALAGDETGDNVAADSHRSTPAPVPCEGPHCSNGSFPPAAPPPVVNVPVDRWAVVPCEAAPNLLFSSNLLAESPDVVVDGSRLSILRPPR